MLQIGLFNEGNRLDKLSELGDSLEKLNAVMEAVNVSITKMVMSFAEKSCLKMKWMLLCVSCL